MRAAVYRQHGLARDVLRIVELPDPTPAPGEVRVRLRVSGVNQTDWKSRLAGPALARGQIPNEDGAGQIDAVGAGVDPASIG
jgi:NADPH2:quinone reductase